jgi:beta-lactamase regulating signal transducer with metallopeptidase domain
MSPDIYLQFAAAFAGYVIKIAVAYLLCWLFARLLGKPGQKFVLWLTFMFASIAYWIYAVTSATSLAAVSGGGPGTGHGVPRIAHQFLIPFRFERLTVILGRGLVCGYILGVLALVAVGLWKRFRLHFLLRRGGAPSSELRLLFEEMCRHFRIRHCELLVLGKVSSPATVCWWRPRIVLPEVCERMGHGDLMADVLYHELAHVARRDYFWSTINDLICLLLFFHPAVWQARRQLRIQREMACDLAVVAVRPEHRADYAHTLTRVARLCLPRKYSVIGIDFASAPSLLTRRVRAILSDPEKSSWIKRLGRVAAGFALISVYGVLCSVVAIALAFAPSAQLSRNPELHTTRKLPERPAPRRKVVREAISRAQAEGLVTESPAYRFKASERSFVDQPEISLNREERGDSGANVAQGSGWTAPRSGPNAPQAGRTLESIIVATIGTVIGSDKDDRNKRKDSSHLRGPAGSPNLQ